MSTEISRRWVDAPLAEIDAANRWVRFDDGGGRSVYLQRYAWDEETRPHYLVVCPNDEDAEQERYVTLDEALWAVRALCGHGG